MAVADDILTPQQRHMEQLRAPVPQLSIGPTPDVRVPELQPQVVDRVAYIQQQVQARKEAEAEARQARALYEQQRAQALQSMLQNPGVQQVARYQTGDPTLFGFTDENDAWRARQTPRSPEEARRAMDWAATQKQGSAFEAITKNPVLGPVYDVLRTDIPEPIREYAKEGVKRGLEAGPVGQLAGSVTEAATGALGKQIRPSETAAELAVPREVWDTALTLIPAAKARTVEELIHGLTIGDVDAVRAARQAAQRLGKSEALERSLKALQSESGALRIARQAPVPAQPTGFLAPLRDFADAEAKIVTGTGPAKQVLAKTGTSPGLVNDNPLGRALLAYRAQLAAGEQATNVGVQAALDVHARRLLGTDPLGMTPEGKIAGRDWHDVFATPPAALKPAQRAYIDDFKKLVAEVEDMREAAGLPSRRKIANYIPRKVLEVRGIQIRGKTRAALPRVYTTPLGEGAEEATQKGIQYAGPRETMQDHIRNAYQEIAAKQLSDAIEDLGIPPSRLVPDAVRSRMTAAVKARRAAESDVRRLRFNVAATRDVAKARGHYQSLQQARARLDMVRGEYTTAKRAYSRAMDVARHREVAPGAFWGPNQPTEIAVRTWRNNYYPREWIDRIDNTLSDMIQPQRQQAVWSKGIEWVGNHVRFLSAVGDFAAPMTHGLPLFGRDPVAWARAAGSHYAAWFDPTIQARHIRDNLDVYQEMARNATPIGDVEFFNALRLGQEEAGGSLGKALARTRPTRILSTQTFGRFQASYDTFLGMARAELTRAFRSTIRDEAERQRLVRNMTGGLDSRLLGVTASQRGGEAAWLAFSPRLLRSTVAFAAELRRPWTQGGREAWRSAAGLVSGVTGLYIAAGLAMDRDWDEIEQGLNPLNGKRFLSYKVNDDWIGVGGQIRALVQLMAQSAANPEKLLKRDRFDNPLLAFYGTRGAPAIGVGEAVLEGGFGVESDPYRDIDGIPDMIKHIGTSAIPFVVQNLIEGQGREALGASMLGARTSAETQTEVVDDLVVGDKISKTGGGLYEHYRDLPPDIRGEFDKRHAEEVGKLQEVRAERGFGTFDTIRKETVQGLGALAPLAETDPAKYREQAGTLIRDQAVKTREALKELPDLDERKGDLGLLDAYYEAVEKATDPVTHVTDFDERDRIEDAFRDKRTPEENRRLDEMLGYSADPTYQKLKIAKKQLGEGGYFDRRDEAFSEWLKEIDPPIPAEAKVSIVAFAQWLKEDVIREGYAPEMYTRDRTWRSWEKAYEAVSGEFLIMNPELDALAVEWGYQARVHSEEAARLYEQRTGLQAPIPAR